MPEAFVLQTLCTARTKASPRGGFAGTSPVDLLVSLPRELVRRTGMDPGRVEDVIIGCASPNAEQGANVARTATMLAGWGNMPGVSINRFCASGIDTVATAAARIRGGDAELVAAGGVESVSRVPLAAHPEVGEIRHLHTVGTSPALADVAALVLIGSQDAAKRLGVAVLIERVAA